MTTGIPARRTETHSSRQGPTAPPKPDFRFAEIFKAPAYPDQWVAEEDTDDWGEPVAPGLWR
ncbi:hypothetical protein GCM10010346_57220 [Streptomyces chryseus]|uniref:Uncharacterized protein n=1 Tax=Streptomyces chryseus TaxID=68186 RepID=A0ABQ3E4Q7_9ACTN|nr:hypothetical protein GCM10010346_57220 [Streptomyces chryseus]